MSYKRAGPQKKFYDAIIFSMNHCFVLLTRRHGGGGGWGGGGSVGKEGIKLIFIFSHVRQHPLHNSQLTNKMIKLIIKDISSSTSYQRLRVHYGILSKKLSSWLLRT